MTNGDKPPARIRSLKSQDGKLQSHLEWPYVKRGPFTVLSGDDKDDIEDPPNQEEDDSSSDD